jgi:NADH-quinone oxidoreductase subunit L
MGGNFIMLYLGWEGVGLCSYLLIGYYYERPAAREAAKKAFLVNRIGDFGFGLGIMLIFLTFGTVSYFGSGAGSHTGVLELATLPLDQLSQIPGVNTYWVPTAMKWIPFLLMVGAFGKSAQFPLHVWLPDAMEGPTPVSALIHAATMVTAGVYMIARCSTLFVGNPAAMSTVAGIGVFTAFMAATIALRQFDLKKVFAYSTISQLGYMFVGVGVLAPTAAAFHLVTHAFFKALLFLSSGVVMHAMLGHLDMRKMSGLKKVLPKTNIVMLVGCLALAGFPPFSGFFSKDEIIARAGVVNHIIWFVAAFTALLTAYYTFRLYFRVFQGPLLVPTEPAEANAHPASHDDAHAEAGASHSAVATGTEQSSGVDKGVAHGHGDGGHHNHEPMIMLAPLFLLAIGALFAGFLNWPAESLAHFLGNSPSFQLGYQVAQPVYTAHPVNAGLWGQPTDEKPPIISVAMVLGFLISAAGIFAAYYYHLKNRAAGDALAARFPAITRFLEAKWWFDEIYTACIVNPLRMIGEFFYGFDRWIIDMLVNLAGWICQVAGYFLKFSTQRGYLQGYGAAMVLGIAAILLLIFMR